MMIMVSEMCDLRGTECDRWSQWSMRILVISLVASVFSADQAWGEDWPAWRHDAERSAVTQESLPTTLTPLWTRSLGPNHIAWREDMRLQFDAAYEPIVVGKQLVLASARDNAVYSFHTDTGEHQWHYLLPAPPRLAPFAHRGHVYFVADDSRIYCLDLVTGKLIWSLKGAPSDRMVLGNSRLISTWPARGGVVITGDVAYFTVGVWPLEGCFLCQVNVDGQPPRLQTKLVSMPEQSGDADNLEEPTPQGHLVFDNGRLLLPNGRGAVGCYDVATLNRLDISYAASRGLTEAHVTSARDLLMHGDALVDLASGQQLDVRLQRPLVDGNIIYGTRAEVRQNEQQQPQAYYSLAAYELSRRTNETSSRDGSDASEAAKPSSQLWTTELPEVPEAGTRPVRLVLKANQQLYGIRGQRVFAVDVSDHRAKPSVVWQQAFDSIPVNVVAADQKLFVVTQDGTLHALGAPSITAEGAPPRAPRSFPTTTADRPHAAAWSEQATLLLRRAGVMRGRCLVIGAGSGGLIEELLRQSQLDLVVIEPDADRAKGLRERLLNLREHGKRVTVLELDPAARSLPPYFARLIVSEDWNRFSPTDRLVSELYRVLRPYGGTITLGSPSLNVAADAEQELQTMASKDGLEGVQVSRHAGLVSVRRAGPLPGSADWTHEYGDAANSLMSQDQRVRAPLGILWFGGPGSQGELYYDRHYWGPGLTVVNGRMVVQGPTKLTSIDIYTGDVLWQQDIRDGSGPGREGNFFDLSHPGFHFTSSPEYVYLAYPEKCLVLDAETGQTAHEFTLPHGDDQWGKIRVWEDQLLVTVFRNVEKGALAKAMQSLNRHTGELQWRQEARMSMPMMAVGGGRVFCFDGELKGFYDAWIRKGMTPESHGHRLLRCFDVTTGEPIWERTSDRVATWLAFSADHNVLITSNQLGLDAMSGENGRTLWKKDVVGQGFKGHPEHLWDKVILSGDVIIDQRGPGRSYRVDTGEAVQQTNPITEKSEEWQFTKTGHHCNYAVACPHLMTFRAGTAGYLDRNTNGTGRLLGFRSGCRNSLIPAGGLLNAPNYAHGCNCNYNLFTSLALVHTPDNDLWTYSPLAAPQPGDSVHKIGVNLAAPGDRLDDQGTLWLEYPPAADPSPALDIRVEGETRPFRLHTSRVAGSLPWVGASGLEGLRKITLAFPKGTLSQPECLVQLIFLDPNSESAGQRRFRIKIQGQTVEEDLDIVREARRPLQVLMRAYSCVASDDTITVDLEAIAGDPVLCGLRVESSGRP